MGGKSFVCLERSCAETPDNTVQGVCVGPAAAGLCSACPRGHHGFGGQCRFGRGEAVRGRPELYREGRKASTGEERELSLPKGPPEPRGSRKGEGEGQDAEGAALEVSELTHPWIYAARPSGKSLGVSRAGLGSVLRIC